MKHALFSAEQVRHAGAADLAVALADSRARTLALLAAYQSALGEGLAVPQHPELNPPLWELGHIAWFQEFWLARNPQRLRGSAADADAPRAPSLLAQADVLFNSSTVAHATRWQLPLLDTRATLAYLQTTLAQTLKLLAAESDDDPLYFFRLALLHEDMHGEAWVQMAQSLGIPLNAAAASVCAHASAKHSPVNATREIELPARSWQLGSAGSGFVFDNECGAHTVALQAFHIDAQPVSLAQFLAFVDDGGYANANWWSAQGWQWRTAQHPPHLRRTTGGWEQQRFGQWQAANLTAPAVHINYFEAQAWCQWAGRRLPSEAEWECAAITQPTRFGWGQVWEWTASAFAPYPGFTPHPYRDYSAPWFHNHQVLRGASFATNPRIKHPRYRNFYLPQRNGIFAGFRSCAVLA